MVDEEKRPDLVESSDDDADENIGDIDADLAVLLPRTEDTDTGLEISVSGRGTKTTQPITPVAPDPEVTEVTEEFVPPGAMHPADQETQYGMDPPVLSADLTQTLEEKPARPARLARPGSAAEAPPPPPPPPPREKPSFDFQPERVVDEKRPPNRAQIRKESFEDLRDGPPAPPPPPPDEPIEDAFPKRLRGAVPNLSEAATQHIPGHKRISEMPTGEMPVAEEVVEDAPPPPPPPPPPAPHGDLPPTLVAEPPETPVANAPPPPPPPPAPWDDEPIPEADVVGEPSSGEDAVPEIGTRSFDSDTHRDYVGLDPESESSRHEIPLEDPGPLLPVDEADDLDMPEEGLGISDEPIGEELTIPIADDEIPPDMVPGEVTEPIDLGDFHDFGEEGGDIVDREFQDFMGGGDADPYASAPAFDPDEQIRDYSTSDSRDLDTPYSKEELENLFTEEPAPVPPWEKSSRRGTASRRASARRPSMVSRGKLLLFLILVIVAMGVSYQYRDHWFPGFAKAVVNASRTQGWEEQLEKFAPAVWKKGDEQLAIELSEKTKPEPPPQPLPPVQPPEPEPEKEQPDYALIDFLKAAREAEDEAIPEEPIVPEIRVPGEGSPDGDTGDEPSAGGGE